MAFPKPSRRIGDRILIRKLDRLFSDFIRTRDGWTCQRCNKQYPVKSQGLHCSHFFGRTMKSVRFEESNSDSLCYGCHKYWEKEDREGYRNFKLKQLGEHGLNLLTLLAHSTAHPDYKLLIICYSKLLKDRK